MNRVSCVQGPATKTRSVSTLTQGHHSSCSRANIVLRVIRVLLNGAVAD